MGENGERAPLCPFCGEPVRDRKTAILATGDARPAHFDCVLQDIGKREALQPGEKITYLGKGSFGVVSYRSGSNGFVIRKRIAYETPARAAEPPQ